MSPSHHHHDNHHLHRHHYHHYLSHDLHHIHFQLDDKYYPGAAQKVVREQIRCCNRGQSPWFVFFLQLWWFRKKKNVWYLKVGDFDRNHDVNFNLTKYTKRDSIKGFYACIYWKNWRFGRVLMPHRQTARQQNIGLLSLSKV